VFIQETSNLRLAEILLLEGRSDDAIREVSPLLQDANPYITQEALFLEARCDLAKQNWTEMNKIIRQLININPAFSDDLAVNLMRGVAALEQDRPDEALVYVKRYPDEPSALYYQGVAYIKKKEISNALPLYQQVLQKDPSSEWVDRMRLSLGEAF